MRYHVQSRRLTSRESVAGNWQRAEGPGYDTVIAAADSMPGRHRPTTDTLFRIWDSERSRVVMAMGPSDRREELVDSAYRACSRARWLVVLALYDDSDIRFYSKGLRGIWQRLRAFW